MKLYAYNNGSASAKALVEALDIKMIKHEGKQLRSKFPQKLINWGSSRFERDIDLHDYYVINKPEAVADASNKLTALWSFMEAGVACPAFTEDRDEAVGWLGEGLVVARTILNGHSGAGIVICDGAENIPEAPLYTKYVKKEHEYRVHVFQDKTIMVQRKARKLEVPNEEVNWQVRNLAGGFIYANHNIVVDEAILGQAVDAVKSLGLDFGAVDIIVTKKGEAYVLEVNTAPGLSGATLDAYVQEFKNIG